MKRVERLIIGIIVTCVWIPALVRAQGTQSGTNNGMGQASAEPAFVPTGIKDIRNFLERCPTKDPAFYQIRQDFELLQDGLAMRIPTCTEPMSSLSIDKLTDGLIALQTLRTAYYMGKGTEGKLPWTQLGLYDWMSSRISGINFKTAPNQLYCCDEINGKEYFSASLSDEYQRDFKRDWPGIAITLDFFAHEIRHADPGVPGHTTGCPPFPLPTDAPGCDPSYELRNLGSYGIQYWLESQWAAGYLNIGIGCSPQDTAKDYVEWNADAANSVIDRFVTFPPSAVTAIEPYGGPCLINYFDLTIPIGGAASVYTKGSEASTRVGYATSPVASGRVPYGVAVFRFKQNGVVVSEAAVPASPLTTSARIFVDYRSGVATAPGPDGAASIDINTGLAVVNPGGEPTNVTYILRATDGTRVTAGSGTVAAGAHFAKFIHQLKDVAPDFNLPSNFSSATQFGSLEIRSYQPLSVLGLRLTVNQRGETLITSTPVADLTKPVSSTPLYFPQFADGGGYTTTVVLLNPYSKPETGRLSLFADDGAPLVVNQMGGTRNSSFVYSIRPYGVFLFQTDGSPINTNAGSVQVTSDADSYAPIGAAVFSFSQGGILVTESGVPAAAPTTHARIYIDQSGGHGTGLALANPSQSAASVNFRPYGTDGYTPATYGTGAVKLNPNGHTARFIRQLISELPANFTGVLDISSATPIVALTLRSLDNERNDFLLTTFPIADQTQPAPAPIVFPQIADGGGYVTEFILLSAGGAASTSVSLYDETGAPMLIGK